VNDTFGGDGPSTGAITITDNANHGVATVNNGGTPNDPTDDQITYVPNANYNGNDTLIYEICDSDGDCDTAIVYITVNSVDDLPIADRDLASVDEDGSVTIPVLVNDTFGGDGPSTGAITITDNANHGVATVNNGGTPNDPTDDQITYVPNANYNGNDTLIYQICDSDGDCDTAIVYITVNSVDDLPIADRDLASVDEDGSVTIPVLVNDTFGGDGPSTGAITITDNANHGVATVSNGGTPNDPTDDQITYVPNANYNGNDTLIYEICDSDGDCDTAIVYITVNSVDDLPIADRDLAIVDEDGSVTIPVLVNDTFGGDGPSTGSITITDNANHGVATVNNGGTPNDPTDDQITYVPNANYNGNDTLIYEICDSDGDCDTAIVYITVNSVDDLPIADRDLASVDEDGSVTIPVLVNDTFGGDGPSTGAITITDNANHGVATVNNGGTPNDPTDDQITYVPNANYNGNDTLIYEICDSDGDCDTAIVYITVNSVDDLPIADRDLASVDEDGSVTIPVLVNDTFGGDGPSTGAITITDNANHGVATVNNGGTPNDPTDDQITYVPNANYNGNDTLIYEICDSDGDCDTAIVYITVNSVDDLPIADRDLASVDEDGSVTIPVLVNDTFGGDGPSTGSITITDNANHGVATVNNGGTPNDPTDDQITYVPNANYNGNDTLIYEICDSDGDCDTAIVYITVNSVDDLPIADRDLASVDEDGSVTIPVLVNDTFGGDGPSTGAITITDNANHGVATVNNGGTPNDPTDDQITYVPNANYNGNDTLIYEICDSDGDCDTAIVYITINPVNDPPIAIKDFISVCGGKSVLIDILANDLNGLDGQIDPTTVTLFVAPNHGSILINPVNGQILYARNPGFVALAYGCIQWL
jgi:uncharacterized protein with ACT and thioredoxin-like domain